MCVILLGLVPLFQLRASIIGVLLFMERGFGGCGETSISTGFFGLGSV